ncbi:MAG TPA: hypothetical protein VLB01_02045 [Thermodesulfobacteriota bacterium]|nr:hypothetical protein [Thermodesulfobacteriota bacterium]
MSKKLVISLTIIIWLLIQTYIGFFGTKVQRDTWPFTTYSMYAEKHKFGDRAVLLRLYGHTVSGKTIEITHRDFGMHYWGFRRQAWDNLLNPETRETYASELISTYNRRQKNSYQKLRDLQIVSESIEVTRNGPSELIRETLFTYGP